MIGIQIRKHCKVLGFGKVLVLTQSWLMLLSFFFEVNPFFVLDVSLPAFVGISILFLQQSDLQIL